MSQHFNQLPLPLSTSFAEGSPVSLTAWQESASQAVMSGIFGTISPASFARLSPDGWWEKMYRGCCPVREGDTSGASSLTWPRSGTMRNGSVYPLERLALPTVATVSSSWPTPTVNDARNSSLPPSQATRDSLVGAVMRWATPTVNGNYNRKGSSPKSGDGLATQVGGGPLNPTWVEWLMGFPPGWTDLSV